MAPAPFVTYALPVVVRAGLGRSLATAAIHRLLFFGTLRLFPFRRSSFRRDGGLLF